MSRVLVIKSIDSSSLPQIADKLLTEMTKDISAQIDVIESPTPSELPVIASMCLETTSYDCIIGLGIVLKDDENPINSESEFKNTAGLMHDYSTHYLIPVGCGVAYCNKPKDLENVAKKHYSKTISNTLELLNIKHRISLLEDERPTSQQKHN